VSFWFFVGMADEERIGERVLYPDEPAKADLLRLDSLYHIVNNSADWQGFVTWDNSPPVNVAYQTHKFAILDAFQTGFAFLRTRLTDEWILLGPAATAVVRTLPQLIEDEPQVRGRCILFGRLGRIKVYADPDMDDPLGWFVGCHGKCVKGLIVNSPLGFTMRQPE